jgi:hypothetical protein
MEIHARRRGRSTEGLYIHDPKPALCAHAPSECYGFVAPAVVGEALSAGESSYAGEGAHVASDAHAQHKRAQCAILCLRYAHSTHKSI